MAALIKPNNTQIHVTKNKAEETHPRLKLHKIKKYILLASLFCLIAGQTLYPYAVNATTHLEVYAANNIFAAGSQGNLTITIRNSSDYDVVDVEAILRSTVTGITPFNGSQVVYKEIEDSVSYNVNMLVEEDVTVGTYTLTLQLSYLLDGYEAVAVSVPIGIVVNQPSLPMARITASTNKVIPGEINELNFTIQNIADSTINDVDVSLNSSNYLITLQGQVNYHFSTLEAGESRIFTAYLNVLENTPIAAYSVTAQIWYKDDTGYTSTQTIAIPLEVTSQVVTIVPVLTIENLNTTIATPGQPFTIHASIKCNDAPVHNAKATITLDAAGFLKPISPTSISLGGMNPGDSIEVSCVVLVDGTTAATPIPTTLSIAYVDSKGVQRIASEVITVQIEQLTDFKVAEKELTVAEQSSTVEVESSLVLIGTSTSQFTNIEVVSDSNIQALPESSYYLGTLYPDNPVSFTLKFDVAPDAALGDAAVVLRVSYRDSNNIPHQQLLDYPIKIKPTATIYNDFWGWLGNILGIE